MFNYDFIIFLKHEDYAGASALQYQQKLATSSKNSNTTAVDEGVADSDEQSSAKSEQVHSEGESSHGEQPDKADDKETRVLKMLYRGNMAEVSRQDEQLKKAKVFNQKHNYYRNTRCTSVAQEEQSALPAGVTNVHEDSDDDDAYDGEEKEIAREMDELRVAQHWVNQEGWDAAAEGRAVSNKSGKTIELRLDWSDVKKRLTRGTGGEGSSVGDAPFDEAAVLRKYPLHRLDPTQRAFANRVLTWAEELLTVYQDVKSDGVHKPLPLLRSFLAGSAGSGKSTTLKTIVQHIRLLIHRKVVDAKVELTAYTGVAAFNIGFGARTACSAFQIFPNAAWKSQLEGPAFRKLEETWSQCILLIVDEISFIGKAFFARMHFRMQQGKRRCFSEAGLDPNKFTFGNTSIILVGDFGQLEPIGDWSLCDTEATFQSCPKNQRHLWKHAIQGKLLLNTFTEAVLLTKIHRSAEDMWWTESCLRLRDVTCTKKDDYDWWRLHDLDRGQLTAEQQEYFDTQAVWLCCRCEDVGARNGRKLARMGETEKELIHQIWAQHSRKSARKFPSTAFDGLRRVINLVRGCKIMLSRNVAYLYGLANGARGKFIGAVYGPEGIGSFPEALIVDVLEYCGPAFFPEEPTWVPILPITAMKEGTRMTRTQFPVVAGFALTVNKAQGLTIKEGVVLHFVGTRRFRPASKHGLPFVAFTRSENFAMTAFKNLPPWEDFARGRDTDMLRMRKEFTAWMEKLHRKTMRRHGFFQTDEEEQLAHENWIRAD